MLASFLMGMICFSGSILSYSFGNKKVYRVVPLTMFSIIIILYNFGLLGHLREGVYSVDILVVIVYILSVAFIIWRKAIDNIFSELLVPFAFTVISVLVFTILDKGMMAHLWDEFSHWAYVVKEMVLFDDFATAPNSNEMFKSYPPAMSLLQYFFQINNIILQKGNSFTDWRLYLVFHFFLFSLLFPLFDEIGLALKDKIISVVMMVAVFSFFYSDFFGNAFSSLYIDPCIAMLAAYIFMLVTTSDTKDIINELGIILGCVCLILLKDVGMVFALSIGALYAVDRFEKPILRKTNIICVAPIVSSIFAKKLWNNELSRENVSIAFSAKIDFVEYLKLLLFRNGQDYRQNVVDIAVNEFFTKRLTLLSISISYFSLLMLMGVSIVLLMAVLVKKCTVSRKQGIIYSIFPVTLTAVYSLFIGAVYTYRFSELEALRLASYDRYMGICFLFLTLVTLVYMVKVILIETSYKKVFLGLFVLLLIAGEWLPIIKYIRREAVDESVRIREEYDIVVGGIYNNCEPDDKIWFLSKGDDGFAYLASKYACQPANFGNSILNLKTQTEDGSTEYITAEEFLDCLIEENYSYVAIHILDKEWLNRYGVLFEDSNEVTSDSLYRFDKSTRKLEKCD